MAALVETSLAAAARERAQAESARTDAEAGLSAARAAVRTLTADFESLVDAVHRDEIARAEQQMRVDTLIGTTNNRSRCRTCGNSSRSACGSPNALWGCSGG